MTFDPRDEKRQRIINLPSINLNEAERLMRVLRAELDAMESALPLAKKKPTEFLRQFVAGARNIGDLGTVSTAQYAEEWYRIGGGKEVEEIAGVSGSTLWRRAKRKGSSSTSNRASRVLAEVEERREKTDLPTETPAEEKESFTKAAGIPKLGNPYSDEDYKAV